MALAILAIVVVFLVTLVGVAVFLRMLRRTTGEPADPETERAAAKITRS